MVPKNTPSTSSSSSKPGDIHQKMNDFVTSRTPDQSVTNRYLHQMMRIVIAQISSEIGWNSAHYSAIDTLSDITVRYLQQMAKQSKKYTEHYGRAEINADDVALGLSDMNVNISELEEYAQNFDGIGGPKIAPFFPVPRKTNLNMLRRGTAEVITRPDHVHDYMPPMILEAEEKDEEEPDVKYSVDASEVKNETSLDERITKIENMNGHVPLVLEEPSMVPEVGSELVVSEVITEVEVNTDPIPPEENPAEESSDDDIEPMSKAAAVFATFKSTKKLENRTENAAIKRVRRMLEEEGHPVREVTSVIMTTSGYLSESREGRLPETRRPPNCNFFDTSPPPPEKRKKIPTMKKILEGVKKVDSRISDDEMEVNGPGLFDIPDKITPSSSTTSGFISEPPAAAVSDPLDLVDIDPKKLAKLEKKQQQKEKKELRQLKKQKLKSKDKLNPFKKYKNLDPDMLQMPSKERKNKLAIFSKKKSSSKKHMEKYKRKDKKYRKELKLNVAPVVDEVDLFNSIPPPPEATEMIESDEDFSQMEVDNHEIVEPTAPTPFMDRNEMRWMKKEKKQKALKEAFIKRHQQNSIHNLKNKGLVISPTMMPPIPKLSKVKFGKGFKGLPPLQMLGAGGEMPPKKKRGRPRKISDPIPQAPPAGPMPLAANQLAAIGKSMMVKEPSLKMDPPLKVMKIRNEHMEFQDPQLFMTKPSQMSPKPQTVTPELLKRLPAGPGLIPELVPASMRLPKELPPSISITPAAISPAKEMASSSRNFGGGLHPNVCSSVTITRIDMPHQHKLPSQYDDSITPGIGPGPPMLTEKPRKLKVPPPPPLQMPIQADTESGITITPIVMGGGKDRFDIPPPPPLQERPMKAEKASIMAKLEEDLSSKELSSKEQRKKDKEKRKEAKKEKKRKAKEKERSEKKEKDKSDKKKSKKEKNAEPVEPVLPMGTVPKLTLKLSGHSNTTTPVDSPNPPQVFIGSDNESTPKPRIIIKQIEEKKRTPSPDLQVALFSPLVTRPQKPARAAKAHAAAAVAGVYMGAVASQQEIISFPSRDKERNSSASDSKRGRGRPPKGGAPVAAPVAPPPPPPAKAANKSSVTVLETETVGCIIDEQGNKVWICPTCGRQDDGSPMIGCDICDDWYHFPCVGIETEPEGEWYCIRCLKKQKTEGKQKKKKK